MILNAHSYYSLRYGTWSVEELVADAARHGHAALALTDINNSTGTIDFVKACRQQGIKPIAGMECRRDEKVLYTLLARNNAGFRQINEFYTHYSLQKLNLPDAPSAFDDVYVVWALEQAPQRKLEENEFVGVKPAQVRKLVTSRLAGQQSKLLVWTPVTFRDHNDYLLHRNLRAIHKNTLISKLTADDVAAADEMMRTPDDLRKQFADYPQLIINTEKLLDDCSIDFDFKTVKNKQVFTDSRYSDKMLLEKLAIDGMKYRYGAADKTAAERIRHELAIIDKLGFSSYFLMAWDIVRYSMSRGFYHVGRGAAPTAWWLIA